MFSLTLFKPESDTDGETQEEVTTFRMKLDVSEWLVKLNLCSCCGVDSTHPLACAVMLIFCVELTLVCEAVRCKMTAC
ncbi:hypothetical protein, partial [Acinetobacter baumannii]|uniref:hypothetical protein n=1 Tax=Acinetobacter baumannii TaxID=470 RepID=UPI001BB4649E